jgi:hypothetical protein
MEGRRKKAVMGDGSERIWNQAKEHFPGATEIVGLYQRARTSLGVVASCIPNDEINQNLWMSHPSRSGLAEGKIENWRLSSGL